MTEERGGQNDLVTYQRDGHIGFIILNRPGKRNSLNPEVWKDLNKAISMAEEDKETRVILLRGEGKPFCVGLGACPRMR